VDIKYKEKPKDKETVGILQVSCKLCGNKTEVVILDTCEIGAINDGWYLIIDRGKFLNDMGVITGFCPECSKNIDHITIEFH